MPSTSTRGVVGIHILEDFADPALQADRWDALVARGTDVVFLTYAWQREWWRAFGSERLVIVLAEDRGQPRAIAPLFTSEDMLFLVGTGGSDYLDFIGELDEPTLASMLGAARATLPDFAGIGLYHMPLPSRTTALLPGVAARLGLELHREGGGIAPYLDLSDTEAVTALLQSKSLRKQESRMLRAGPLRVRTAERENLDEWLELFLAQHASRWQPAGEASFGREGDRAFCQAIVRAGHRDGWLRFTMLEWQGAPAAFDISLVRGQRHLSYVVSRDPSIHEYSPGRLLEARIVASALAAGARCYDYGLGEEDYKLRSASGVIEVANWFLYPPSQ
jgi:CelD/BcsL family acetyltransferase involved in cellulose biosynthesis